MSLALTTFHAFSPHEAQTVLLLFIFTSQQQSKIPCSPVLCNISRQQAQNTKPSFNKAHFSFRLPTATVLWTPVQDHCVSWSILKSSVPAAGQMHKFYSQSSWGLPLLWCIRIFGNFFLEMRKRFCLWLNADIRVTKNNSFMLIYWKWLCLCWAQLRTSWSPGAETIWARVRHEPERRALAMPTHFACAVLQSVLAQSAQCSSYCPIVLL